METINPNKKVIRIAFTLLVSILFSTPVFSQQLKVAVAANLQPVIIELQKDFAQKTGIQIDPIVGSSGTLMAQMKNGAPFDVFLSADMAFPKSLFDAGLSVKAPTIYAYGSLILCSTNNIGFENWQRTLMTNRIKKIAIANPDIAPYGQAAKTVLARKGILDNINKKLVYGQSIAQVNTYITTGVVQAAFTSLSLIKDPANKTKLYWKIIDPKTYPPIEQGLVVLKSSANKTDAEKFYNYILSAPAKKIFLQFGYHTK
jgi:molybdate transport system substrate-binding protein